MGVRVRESWSVDLRKCQWRKQVEKNEKRIRSSGTLFEGNSDIQTSRW